MTEESKTNKELILANKRERNLKQKFKENSVNEVGKTEGSKKDTTKIARLSGKNNGKNGSSKAKKRK